MLQWEKHLLETNGIAIKHQFSRELQTFLPAEAKQVNPRLVEDGQNQGCCSQKAGGAGNGTFTRYFTNAEPQPVSPAKEWGVSACSQHHGNEVAYFSAILKRKQR